MQRISLMVEIQQQRANQWMGGTGRREQPMAVGCGQSSSSRVDLGDGDPNGASPLPADFARAPIHLITAISHRNEEPQRVHEAREENIRSNSGTFALSATMKIVDRVIYRRSIVDEYRVTNNK